MVLLNELSTLSKYDVRLSRAQQQSRYSLIGFLFWLSFFAVVSAIAPILIGMSYAFIGNIFDRDQELNIVAWAVMASLLWISMGLPLWLARKPVVVQKLKRGRLEYVFTRAGFYASSHLVFPATEWSERQDTEAP